MLRLEDTLVRLGDAQARTEAALARLAEAQTRTEERLTRLETQVQTFAQAQARTEERLTRLETQVQILAAAQARTETQVQILAAAQARTEMQVQTLAAAQARTEAALTRLAEAQARTEEQLARQGTQLQTLMNWQRGETGRRDGERYERDVVRRAAVLFNGGSGGAPDRLEVQRRLAKRLHTVLAEGILPSEADPFLADLLWWKGEQVAVVEVSLQVDGDDINRVTQRTQTLRRGGIQARAIVIGEDWATRDTQERARALQVDWKVGDDLSSGFLAFRRLALEESTGAGSLC
jgi:hypothetical protein